MKPIVSVEDIAKKVVASQSDPGQFAPCLHQENESLAAWQKRALDIAIAQCNIPLELDIQEICKECCEDSFTNSQSVIEVFQWLRSNGFGIHHIIKK